MRLKNGIGNFMKMDKKIKVIERKLSEWDDLGNSRKLKEVELEEVRRLMWNSRMRSRLKNQCGDRNKEYYD